MWSWPFPGGCFRLQCHQPFWCIAGNCSCQLCYFCSHSSFFWSKLWLALKKPFNIFLLSPVELLDDWFFKHNCFFYCWHKVSAQKLRLAKQLGAVNLMPYQFWESWDNKRASLPNQHAFLWPCLSQHLFMPSFKTLMPNLMGQKFHQPASKPLVFAHAFAFGPEFPAEIHLNGLWAKAKWFDFNSLPWFSILCTWCFWIRFHGLWTS